MAELLGIYDGGTTVDKKGHKVGVIIFRISNNEGAPENMIAHCLPNYRESVIKNLKRLAFQKEERADHDGGREESS